jgi:hypothetical protein
MKTTPALNALELSVLVLDPLKIALYEYEHDMIPIDTDPHLD